MVLAAVAQDGYALQFAAASLKEDKDVVLAAVAQNRNAIQFAAASLQRDKDFLIKAKEYTG